MRAATPLPSVAAQLFEALLATQPAVSLLRGGRLWFTATGHQLAHAAGSGHGMGDAGGGDRVRKGRLAESCRSEPNISLK